MQEKLVDKVNAYFSEPLGSGYLTRSDNIRIRTETIQAWLADRPAQTTKNILDIGCGDGSISAPLLREDNSLTLLDISEYMLSVAIDRISEDLRRNVRLIQGDFMLADLSEGSFDTILCIGVLAHIASPEAMIARMCSMLKPDGMIFVQVSDAEHPVGRIWGAYCRLRDMIKRPTYRLNRMSSKHIIREFARHGLVVRSRYRYNMAPPGMCRLLSPAWVYRFNRMMYGDTRRNRNAWLGNENIFCFAPANEQVHSAPKGAPSVNLPADD